MPHFVALTSQISLTQSINQQKSIKNDQLPKYSRYQGPAMKYLLKLLESEDTKFHLVAFVSLFSTVLLGQLNRVQLSQESQLQKSQRSALFGPLV